MARKHQRLATKTTRLMMKKLSQRSLRIAFSIRKMLAMRKI